MNHEERDDLWELLGQAKKPTVPPFFAQNVLREIRQQEREPAWRGLFGSLRGLLRSWQFGTLAACGLMVASFSLWQHSQQRGEMTRLAQAVSSSPDYAVISHLDELLAYEENSVWLDKPAY